MLEADEQDSLELHPPRAGKIYTFSPSAPLLKWSVFSTVSCFYLQIPGKVLNNCKHAQSNAHTASNLTFSFMDV